MELDSLIALSGGVSEHEFAGKFHLGISHSSALLSKWSPMWIFSGKNLDFMDFLCISLGSEKNNQPIPLS